MDNVKAIVTEFKRVTDYIKNKEPNAELFFTARSIMAYRLMIDEGLKLGEVAIMLNISEEELSELVNIARLKMEGRQLNFLNIFQQGRWLKEMREYRQLTREQLAAKISQDTEIEWVEKAENGHVKIGDPRIIYAFQALDVKVGRYFFG
ncbi:helix-turn-helix transcriptional regulator [Corynebacterium sp. sy039]|uniref:helix-turn-helix domain-containing protein n=1 Tax=Corynebacterium sp. sy039 TaxID=2599641 RepID=UPI0011B58C56|nr:helix-turn-helix transcriptional regulator [Corynebacterium sp. sy039]QDZ42742.1 helix-turn-helix transcriptional regulator [Corynebacterium sp. sy039]